MNSNLSFDLLKKLSKFNDIEYSPVIKSYVSILIIDVYFYIYSISIINKMSFLYVLNFYLYYDFIFEDLRCDLIDNLGELVVV